MLTWVSEQAVTFFFLRIKLIYNISLSRKCTFYTYIFTRCSRSAMSFYGRYVLQNCLAAL